MAKYSMREQFAKSYLARTYRAYLDRLVTKHIAHSQIVVDVGCGEGVFLERLGSKRSPRLAVGVDPDGDNVRTCHSHEVSAIQGTAYELPLGDMSVNACVLMSVLEHLEFPERALAELERVLRPGGVLVVVVPNDAVFEAARLATLRFREARLDYGHVVQWNPQTLRKEIAKRGFKIVSSRNTPFVLWPVSLHHFLVAVREEKMM